MAVERKKEVAGGVQKKKIGKIGDLLFKILLK